MSWKATMLEDRLPMMPLSVGRSRISAGEGRMGTYEFPFSTELTRQVRSLQTYVWSDLHTVLLTAFQVLLYRYCGQEEVWTGLPLIASEVGAGRAVFVRTLLSGDMMFQELVHRVAQGVSMAGESPTVVLGEESFGKTLPGVLVLFSLLQGTAVELELTGSVLLLTVREEEGQLLAQLRYPESWFDEVMIRRMAEHYLVLLSGVAADAHQQVDTVPMQTDQEWEHLHTVWEATVQDVHRPACVHQWFEEQAQRSPDAIAAICDGEQLTYAQLNERANEVAHQLHGIGVVREALVGLFVDRSLEMVVGMLAIWKAGGAYVPLDPAYPTERLALMLDESCLRVVLTSQARQGQLPEADLQILCLDARTEGAAQEVRTCPPPIQERTGADLAYVIFTSGSTGRPKGVQIEHRSVVNFLHSMIERPGIKAEDILLSVTTLSFDISVLELWLPLVVGAKVVIVSRETAADGQQLLEALSHHQVTIMQATPATWRILLEAGWAGNPRMKLLCGGEALPRDLALKLHERSGSLWNLYGPTEATVWATVEEVDPAHAISIGRPIANTRVYVLDAKRQPVPPGVVGELYIAGAGLARGYLNRPDLTAEKFVPDPFARQEGARMYASGDLARQGIDGALECLGRVDHQVKLRGFRIELEEIEAHLANRPDVREAVVLMREDVPSDPFLAAYVVLHPKAEDDLQDEQVSKWEQIFDSYYDESETGSEDLLFNIGIWTSSYTRQPIPRVEMVEWVEQTVERLRALKAQNVLEMGVGTGLLLFRLAPHVQSYLGADLSQQALQYIQQQVEARSSQFANVSLQHRAADHYEGITPGSLDLVILNSVVQYFPNLDYLVEVLRGAVRVVQPGGHVFVGDVRDYRLLELFHQSVERFRASDEQTVDLLRQAAQLRMEQEQELVISPAFFQALAREWPEIGHVEVRVKRGHFQNEMSRFRYDVILHVGAVSPRTVEREVLWEQDGLSVQDVGRLLREEQPESMALLGVFNARVAEELLAQKLLGDAEGPATVGELRARLQMEMGCLGIEPEAWYALAKESGYQAEVLATGDAVGCYDVMFVREGETMFSIPALAHPQLGDAQHPRTALANQPLKAVEQEWVADEMRRHLEDQLPRYMVPEAIVMLESIPRTPNGKTDRKALPAPTRVRFAETTEYRAASNPIEDVLVQTLSEAMHGDRVSVEHSFLSLGGHSLLATRVVSRLRQVYGVEVPVRLLMESVSLSSFAKQVQMMIREQKVAQMPPLVSVEREQDVELSFAQQRLWFTDQLEEGKTPFYNITLQWLLQGTLHVEVVERCLQEIVRRHEALRTVFPHVQGRPVQVIKPFVASVLPVLDLRQMSEQERQTNIEEQVRIEAEWCFDLVRGPLFRAQLLRLTESEALLFVNMHHIVSDGLSLVVLRDEFVELYDAYMAEERFSLQELPLQYADYAVWQRAWLQEDLLAVKLAYWKRKLGGTLPVLELPTDFPRGDKQTFLGENHTVWIEERLTEQLYAFGRREGFTMFMLLMAAYKLLLYLNSKQSDVIVGSPVANREHHDLKGMIGFFINTLIFRTDLSGDASLQELLLRFRETAYEAYENQEVPFEKLVEELQPKRDLRFPPIYQVWFVMHNQPVLRSESPYLVLEPQTFDGGWAQFDVTLAIEEHFPRLKATFNYNRELFQPQTVERMVLWYEKILRSFVEQPELRISELLRHWDKELSEEQTARQRQLKQSRFAKLKSGAVSSVSIAVTKGDV